MPNHPPIDHRLADAARQHYGLTRRITEAGYILDDGSMLDFSGRCDDSGPGTGRDLFLDRRLTDHSDIAQLFDSGDEGMLEFMHRTGAIRVGHPKFASFTRPPSAAAAHTLIEGFADSDHVTLEWHFLSGTHGIWEDCNGRDLAAVLPAYLARADSPAMYPARALVRRGASDIIKGIVSPMDRPAEKGEIVVNDAAEIALLDRLGMASAVIVDTGSATCHLAIVLREMQIPMMRVANAVRRWPTGTALQIDICKDEISVLDGENFATR